MNQYYIIDPVYHSIHGFSSASLRSQKGAAGKWRGDIFTSESDAIMTYQEERRNGKSSIDIPKCKSFRYRAEAIQYLREARPEYYEEKLTVPSMESVPMDIPSMESVPIDTICMDKDSRDIHSYRRTKNSSYLSFPLSMFGLDEPCAEENEVTLSEDGIESQHDPTIFSFPRVTAQDVRLMQLKALIGRYPESYYVDPTSSGISIITTPTVTSISDQSRDNPALSLIKSETPQKVARTSSPDKTKQNKKPSVNPGALKVGAPLRKRREAENKSSAFFKANPSAGKNGNYRKAQTFVVKDGGYDEMSMSAGQLQDLCDRPNSLNIHVSGTSTVSSTDNIYSGGFAIIVTHQGSKLLEITGGSIKKDLTKAHADMYSIYNVLYNLEYIMNTCQKSTLERKGLWLDLSNIEVIIRTRSAYMYRSMIGSWDHHCGVRTKSISGLKDMAMIRAMDALDNHKCKYSLRFAYIYSVKSIEHDSDAIILAKRSIGMSHIIAKTHGF